MKCTDPSLQRVVDAYEALTPATLPLLLQLYAPQARFKDPFNDVRGRAGIGAVFEHMFAQLEAPRFIVLTAIRQEDQAMLVWRMGFSLPRYLKGPQSICGASHLHFDGDELVAEHRDYWDAAEELYEKLPVIGAAVRTLRRTVAG
jgi:steroid delta-isomerase